VDRGLIMSQNAECDRLARVQASLRRQKIEGLLVS